MKMVKSLLLGSAATLIAVAGAQAADLPVKAKAVEYVKVCSLYGAGFYYIPGTDTCIKIGGYLRADYNYNSSPTFNTYLTANANSRYDRADTNDVTTRARFNVSWDVRSQTEYGTLRSFARTGWQWTTASQGGTGANIGLPNYGTVGTTNDIYIDRAFIQFAGFTFGKAESFFDFFSGGFSSATVLTGRDNSGNGVNQIAYTAQLGNGLSLTLSAEDPTYNRDPLVDANNLGSLVYGAAASDYAGTQVPDFVGTLRLDQAWGSAQLNGALHQVNAGYYGANSVTNSVALGTHPSDKWGWAVQGGLLFNVPTGAGDQLILQAAYAEGATPYLSQGSAFGAYQNGNNGTPNLSGGLALGFITDGVFAAPGSVLTTANGGAGGTASGNIELTKGWTALGMFQHFWTPNLKSSLWGGVVQIDYDDAATQLVCTNLTAGTGIAFAAQAGGSCNPDFRIWQTGLRTVWTPVQNLDLSVEVMYAKIDQNFSGNFTTAASGSRSAGTYQAMDADNWSVLFRAQRNFWY